MDDTEKFLIGRVDGVSTQSLTNGWELKLKHVRITEVAPTNSSIVDGKIVYFSLFCILVCLINSFQ